MPWAGSLWDPNITVETLEAHRLRVDFTLWNESARYQILLSSFPHMENQSCFDDVQNILKVTLCHLLTPLAAQNHLSTPPVSLTVLPELRFEELSTQYCARSVLTPGCCSSPFLCCELMPSGSSCSYS